MWPKACGGSDMRVYVAGPYSGGDIILNIRAAIRAASRIMDAGHAPFCPHLTGIWHLVSPKEYEQWLAYDFEWIRACEALVRLPGEAPGGEDSRGGRDTSVLRRGGILGGSGPEEEDKMTLAPWFDETYIVAEIGINHNGNFEMAKELVLMAARCGVNAVKFQKRSPELCVPKDQWNLPKQTPWGIMDYLGYRYLMEFNSAQYRQLQCIARTHDLDFFASVWDGEAVEFMKR